MYRMPYDNYVTFLNFFVCCCNYCTCNAYTGKVLVHFVITTAKKRLAKEVHVVITLSWLCIYKSDAMYRHVTDILKKI